jgi:hypothetical protein
MSHTEAQACLRQWAIQGELLLCSFATENSEGEMEQFKKIAIVARCWWFMTNTTII